MKSAIFMNGNKFDESLFNTEEAFEIVVKENSKTLFGTKSIYFDVKGRIDSRTFGSAIPDAFLFDFQDEENPDFYLVEVELEKHDFYNHIFPQITKFLAFFKNPASISNLIERLFSLIKSNSVLEKEFKQYLGGKEIYKALKDIIENSQSILIILDDNKAEINEVSQTYSEWDRIVKVEIVKRYTTGDQTIFTMNPDFEAIDIVEPNGAEAPGHTYPESYHLERAEKGVVDAYEAIKQGVLSFDSAIKINSQKNYISLKKNKNFAYIAVRKKKLNIVVMLPFEGSGKLIKKHKITQLSQRVQVFYNGPCFKVTLENNQNAGEIIEALKEAYKQQK